MDNQTNEFDAMKALRIVRSRIGRLRPECEDSDTRAGLEDLQEWLNAVIDDILPQTAAPAHVCDACGWDNRRKDCVNCGAGLCG
jgi:hypothetical protein